MAAIVAICCISCSGHKSDSGKRQVLTVSQAPQKYLLKGIVGDLYDVNVLIPPNADAETFDPSMQTLTSVGESKLFFPVGLAGMEPAIVARIRSGFPSLKIVDTLDGVPLIRGTHAEGDADPHVFSSPRTLKVMARNMLTAMEQNDPQNVAIFRKNYTHLVAELDSLDMEASRYLKNAPRAFAIWHPSLSYFARDYNLTQLTFEAEGKEASPSQFRHRLDDVIASDARVMIIEPTHGTERPATIARQSRLRTAEINLNTEDWPSQFRALVAALSTK